VFSRKWRDFRIVHKIATVFLGTIGGTVVVLGVIVLITSGTPPLERQEWSSQITWKLTKRHLKNRWLQYRFCNCLYSY
jgi:hypothetical protein